MMTAMLLLTLSFIKSYQIIICKGPHDLQAIFVMVYRYNWHTIFDISLTIVLIESALDIF
jgi:hypothetical protein